MGAEEIAHSKNLTGKHLMEGLYLEIMGLEKTIKNIRQAETKAFPRPGLNRQRQGTILPRHSESHGRRLPEGSRGYK